MIRRILPWQLLTLFVAGCTARPVTRIARAAATAATTALAPRPFNASQIRDGIPAGTHIRLRIEQAGRPTTEQRWTFTATTAETATIASQVYSADGVLVNDEGTSTTTWDELETHASFPASQTVRSEGQVDVPAGHFATWDYTVTRPDHDGGPPRVSVYHFARSLPGPPVLFTTSVDGIEVFRMTMVERSPSRPTPSGP